MKNCMSVVYVSSIQHPHSGLKLSGDEGCKEFAEQEARENQVS
jgi:hypothetical protein